MSALAVEAFIQGPLAVLADNEQRVALETMSTKLIAVLEAAGGVLSYEEAAYRTAHQLGIPQSEMGFGLTFAISQNNVTLDHLTDLITLPAF